MKYLLTIIILIVLYFAAFHGEKIFAPTCKEVSGKYIFVSDMEEYHIFLQTDKKLKLKKYIKNHLTFNETGYWDIKKVGNTYFIEEKVNKIDNLEFSLGMIKKNLLTGHVKIEALSMGHFNGEEDGAFFEKRAVLEAGR